MARSSTPSESWVELYQQNVPLENITSSTTRGMVTDSTVVSTSPAQVSRPIRRRPRATRRNPTTVLNTDPTNFRAMVQQFTGGYANMGTSLYSYPREIPSSIDFCVGEGIRQQNVSSEAVYRQFLQLQFHHQQQRQQQQRRQGGQDSNGQDSNDAFLRQMIGNSGSDVENTENFGP